MYFQQSKGKDYTLNEMNVIQMTTIQQCLAIYQLCIANTKIPTTD